MTRFARLRDVPAAFRELADDVRAALSDNQTVPVPETALDLHGVPDRARAYILCGAADGAV